MVAVGVVLAVHWYLFFETIKLSSVAVAVLTVYTAPVFLALLAPLFLPERRSRVALVALIPASLGLVLMSTWGSGATHARPLAIVTGIAAAITYALLVIGTKRLRARMGPVTITAWTLRDRGARARAVPRHRRPGDPARLGDRLRPAARRRLHSALGLHLRDAARARDGAGGRDPRLPRAGQRRDPRPGRCSASRSAGRCSSAARSWSPAESWSCFASRSRPRLGLPGEPAGQEPGPRARACHGGGGDGRRAAGWPRQQGGGRPGRRRGDAVCSRR